ncbi:MAG TPA: hydrogenase 3 maturation endopeptidase HyCI [Anaerolineales bacterium]
MSNSQWKRKLLRSLEPWAEHTTPPRVAVMGVGNELKGDDALGVHLARALKPRVHASERLLVIEAGLAPENFCGLLRRFKPDVIILVDAVHMGAGPGTVRALDLDSATRAGLSTHNPSFHMLVEYLQAELGCEFLILGVQVAGFSFEAPLSPLVEASIGALAEQLADMLVPTLRKRSFHQAALYGYRA